MRLTSRLSLSLIFAVAAVSVAFAFYQIRAQSRGMERDLERQSLMLAESLARAAEPLITSNRPYSDLQRLVERFKDRETVAGVAVYDVEGTPVATTPGLAAVLDRNPPAVAEAIQNAWARNAFFHSPAGPMHIVAVPLHKAGAINGVLAIVNDASYIDTRTAALWSRALMGIAVQTIVIVGIVLLS